MKKIISVIISFIMLFPSYMVSFLPDKTDADFSQMNISPVSSVGIDGGVISQKAEFEFEEENEWFNYFGISYKSNAYMKGHIIYIIRGNEYAEEFFLEPSDGTKPFCSFIDGVLDNVKSDTLCKIMFEPLDKPKAEFELVGVGLFNREVPDTNVYIESGGYKIGVNLLWGGALDYLEDLDSDVEAVKVGGKVYVDSNASARYGKKAINKNVNLINRHDTGRLIQQSYYGSSAGYDDVYYGNDRWGYNPVQGGNQYNEASKIVDIEYTENYIYIKCRPLDWALPAERISPAYMEAKYTIGNGCVNVSCRFVDFSGYPTTHTTQELPAFYCIEPFNRFVYYSGSEPWTGDKNLTYQNDLVFWPDMGYPNFASTENWSAFIGEHDDSFGIGLYTPHNASFLAGIFDRGKTTEKDPSLSLSTSYIAAVQWVDFESYKPMEYNYYIATGNTDEIRSTFNNIR